MTAGPNASETVRWLSVGSNAELPSESWDDLDRSIVRELMADGRKSFRAMASDLGLAEATIRFRMKRLLDGDALKIQAFVDWTKVENRCVADLFLTVDVKHLADALEHLSSFDEAQYVASCTGFANVYIQAVFTGTQELHRFTANELPKIPGFEKVESLVELAVVKMTTSRPGP